ncbi:MAG: serine/threonine protein phosphatase [Streptosporangiaceae bacterium]|nr:serine/threonine protein phosphatase [Streptosporangiaceae bacterium]
MNGEGMLSALLDASPNAALEDLPRLVAEYARQAGLYDAVIYLVDLQQNVLWPLLGDPAILDRSRTEPTKIDGTLPGRSFCEAGLVVAASDPDAQDQEDRQRLWVPILDRSERLGVLSVRVPQHDEASEARLRELASLVALLVVSRRRNSDAYADLIRVREMSLAAELQWTLMPPMTFANDLVVVSGALEPAYEVGGDAFDYALVGKTAHLAIFDAMGHDTAAGLVASIAMGSYRNNRRRGAGLVETSQAIDADIARQFDDRFVTGILAQLDTETGMLSWVNRGHPVPFIIRQGRWITGLECLPTPPMGLAFDEEPLLCRSQLEPGDRLLFYTDGIVEARSPEGEPFGLERFADFVVRREADGLGAPETLRRLIRTLLDYQNGELQDDATVLLAEWCG